jgi:transcriptional regulator with XRE-family HTH domain
LTLCLEKRKILVKIRQQIRRPTLKALRMARADAGLTISELARRAGVSRDTISNAERGEHSLQASTLHKVARALGKAPSELLAEEERLTPKVESRSSLEPSFNDVLEEERREAIYDIALTAARRQNRQDVQAAARLLESGRGQSYFMRHDNEAMQHLLGRSVEELAPAVLDLAHRVVELEEQLQAASVMDSEQSRTRSTSS